MVADGNADYGFLTKFLPVLRNAGVTEAEIETLTQTNPQRFLAVNRNHLKEN